MSRQTNWLPGQQQDESRLDAQLRRLAHESPREAPLSVRRHIQGLIQHHRAPQPEPSLTDRWLLPLAGMASALLVVVAAVWALNAISNRRARNDRMSPVPVTSNRNVEPPPAIEIQKPSATSQLPAARVKKRHHPRPARSQQPAFVALPFSDPALANGTSVTIRITFSDAQLLALGVAPDQNKRRQLYVADVVLGDDGLPRAIRVLPNISGIQGGS
jgi:hypothetical protein